MGGFVFCQTTEAGVPDGFESSLMAMEAKGLPRRSVIRRNRFELHVYNKMRVDTDSVLEMENGDFVVATGTMIYKKRMGTSALKIIYVDHCSGNLSFGDFLGHFAVWILHGDDLTVFSDYRGMYQIYHNEDRSIIASSFLPIYKSSTSITPNTQEIFEYLAYESHFGDKTIIREVRKLDHRVVHGIFGTLSERPKRIAIRNVDGGSSFDEHAKFIRQILVDYFSTLASHFGNEQSIGLTGGYDSRLTLACMRQAGVRPIVYVQGEPDSVDVRIATAIAEGEGFELNYVEDEAKPEFAVDEFCDRIFTAFNYLDGIPHTGIFCDMAMVSGDRRSRERKERLRLYGMAGEIFRRFRHMSDRPHSVAEFMACVYDDFNELDYGPLFNKARVLAGVAEKMRDALGLQGDIMTRQQTELAYPHFSLSRGAGPQMALQNERAFSLVPYAEPVFTYASANVPLDFKYLGKFESELIRLADPRLASYQSAYGFAFDQRPNLKARVREISKRITPISLRPFIRRKIARLRESKNRPFYFEDQYLREVFPDGFQNIEPFVNVRGITDYKMLSRAYTVELILSGKLGGAAPG